MLISLLPSEISRLILNYLEDEGYSSTYAQFLKECSELKECRFYLERGISLPKTIHGKTLFDYLIFDPDIITEKASVGTQTDTSRDSRLLESKNSFCAKEIIKDVEEHTYFTLPIIPTNENKSVIDPIEHSTSSKCNQPQKKRLLIGKNIEKVPELSVSTLERQLGSIISDASNYLKQQEEQEFLNQNQIVQSNDQTVQPIIIDQTTMNSLSSQQFIPIDNSGYSMNFNSNCIAPIQVATSDNQLSQSKKIAIKPKTIDTEPKPVNKEITFRDIAKPKRGPKRLIGPKNKINRSNMVRVKPLISQMIGERPMDEVVNARKMSRLKRENSENKAEDAGESHELYELLGIKNSYLNNKLDVEDLLFKKAMKEVTNNKSKNSQKQINNEGKEEGNNKNNATKDLATCSTNVNNWINNPNA